MTHLRALAILVAVVVAGMALASCGYVKDALNPAHSITITVKSDQHLYREIHELYPTLDNVRETNTENNPNYVSFDVGEQHCTAFVSSVKHRYSVAGSLVTKPFCLQRVPE